MAMTTWNIKMTISAHNKKRMKAELCYLKSGTWEINKKKKEKEYKYKMMFEGYRARRH
jgi:hypothetical protein